MWDLPMSTNVALIGMVVSLPPSCQLHASQQGLVTGTLQ